MTVDEAIRDFASNAEGLPQDAMRWALDNWDHAGPRFLALLDDYAAGNETSQQTEQALFFILHLLAEKREVGAFAPLCRLLEDAETADLLLGEAVTEHLQGILISLFDGNGQGLQTLVETEAADDFVRDAAMLALSYLTRTGRIPEHETRAFLARTSTAMLPQGPHLVWMSWVMAVAHLGYRDLAGTAEAMIRKGRVPSELMYVSHFREALGRTLEDPTGLAGFVHDGIGPFTDTVAELASWTVDAADASLPRDAAFDPPEPVINPLRGVGRNDPCPCGSGKKFKKCCLA